MAENKAKIGTKTLGIRICRDGSSLYEFFFEEGGPLPDDLSCKFTGKNAAITAMLAHFEKRNNLG